VSAMTAAIAVAPAPAPAPRVLPPFPSAAALALEASTWRQLERAFVRGGTPDLDDLIGWEFRGINTRLWNLRPTARLVGLKKFVKGFLRDEDGTAIGYNCKVVQNATDARWHISPKRFGFYHVAPVDATARDNAYLHAVLLDYSKGDNPATEPARVLRDYLVQLDDDMYLGKAYYAFGPARVPSNFFILERHRRGLTDYVRR
jgi:hypothetical protein